MTTNPGEPDWPEEPEWPTWPERKPNLARLWRSSGESFWSRHATELFTLGWDRDGFVDEWVKHREEAYSIYRGDYGYGHFSTWRNQLLIVPR